uniref:Uncharacterized protein n=1 Tax=Arundo donax TaxID=35708 RepID=A0A0A8ZJC5_ARUDO
MVAVTATSTIIAVVVRPRMPPSPLHPAPVAPAVAAPPARDLGTGPHL